MAEKKKDERGRQRRIPEETSLESLVSQGRSKISRAQESQLELIARTNFNYCNGKRVAEFLRENRHMWRAAMMPLDLLSLRDIEDGSWHADTLYIYAQEGYQFQLEELVGEQFHADEVQWIGGATAEGMLGTNEEGLARKSQVILSVWWD